MNKLLLLLSFIFTLTTCTQAQEDYQPDFARLLPFDGLQGKPKMVDIEFWVPKTDNASAPIWSSYHKHQQFFSKQGIMDSMYVVQRSRQELIKYYYKEFVTSRTLNYDTLDGDTTLINKTECEYEWLDKGILLATQITTDMRINKSKSKSDTILIDYDNQSVSTSSLHGSHINTNFYDNHLVAKQMVITNEQQDTLIIEYNYHKNQLKGIKHTFNGKVESEFEMKETKWDKKKNFLEAIFQDSKLNERGVYFYRRRIVYW